MLNNGFHVRVVYIDPQRTLEALEGTPKTLVDVTGAPRHVKN